MVIKALKKNFVKAVNDSQKSAHSSQYAAINPFGASFCRYSHLKKTMITAYHQSYY
jgi:hypothetical protein